MTRVGSQRHQKKKCLLHLDIPGDLSSPTFLFILVATFVSFCSDMCVAFS
jgi:hypothetical protein